MSDTANLFPISALPLQSQCDRVYGNPRGPNGAEVSRSWYAQNIVRIPAPWPMSMGDIRIREITVHRLLAMRLRAMFEDILALAYETADLNFVPSTAIVAPPIPAVVMDILNMWGMTDYGGGYNYRRKRAGSTLSMHAYGAAWDFDADRNGFRDSTPHFSNFPKLVEIFRRYGIWGGDWKTNCDGMHIQFARVV